MVVNLIFVVLLVLVTKKFDQPIRRWICDMARQHGEHLDMQQIHLVSAKTHYGVDRLLTAIWRQCDYAKANAFVVGSTNVGKSSLLNAALATHRAADEVCFFCFSLQYIIPIIQNKREIEVNVLGARQTNNKREAMGRRTKGVCR